MPAHPLRSLLLVALFVLPGPRGAAAAPVPLRIAGDLAGDPVEIEIRDLDRGAAETALGAAWAVLAGAGSEISRLVEQTAGQPTVSPEELRLLARAESFCLWSDGALSPLGAAVYALWERGDGAAAIPTPGLLEPAIAAAKCDRLRLDEAGATYAIAAGSALDLRHFTRGWAVDRAVETLREHGAANLWVRHGAVARGVGGGPDGEGWPYALPGVAQLELSAGMLLLRDQSVAVADVAERPLRIAGDKFARYLDLRTGRPANGVACAVAVTELAGDAEPLAAALIALGTNGGQIRLGALRPRPAVLWMLGSSDSSSPVLATFNWVAVKKR